MERMSMHLLSTILLVSILYSPVLGADEPALPISPIEVTDTGIIFDGGTMSIELEDANGTTWFIGFPHTAIPNPMVDRHLRIAEYEDSEIIKSIPISVHSDAEVKIYNMLTDWLSRTFNHDEIISIHDGTIWDTLPAGRSIFDDEQDDIPWVPNPKLERIYRGNNIVDLLREITLEREIASNALLTDQRDRLRATIHIDTKGFPLVEEARWEQFHETLRAVLCGPVWIPAKLPEKTDDGLNDSE